MSGGLDSWVCMVLASKRHDVFALTVEYGQAHEAELDAAKRIVRGMGSPAVKSHIIWKAGLLGDLRGSSLTGGSHSFDLPKTYVPGRNTMLLAGANALAETVGATSIYAGFNRDDWGGYPDCGPGYVLAFQAALDSLPGGVKLCTPLLGMRKYEVTSLAGALGLDLDEAVSCYRASPEGEACGACDACELRSV